MSWIDISNIGLPYVPIFAGRRIDANLLTSTGYYMMHGKEMGLLNVPMQEDNIAIQVTAYSENAIYQTAFVPGHGVIHRYYNGSDWTDWK